MSQGPGAPVVASPESAPPLEPELPELAINPDPPELDGPLDPELPEPPRDEGEPLEPGLASDPEPASGFAAEPDEPLDPEAEPLLAPAPAPGLVAASLPSPEPHAIRTDAKIAGSGRRRRDASCINSAVATPGETRQGIGTPPQRPLVLGRSAHGRDTEQQAWRSEPEIG
jgi:hypothetical protein